MINKIHLKKNIYRMKYATQIRGKTVGIMSIKLKLCPLKILFLMIKQRMQMLLKITTTKRLQMILKIKYNKTIF